MADTLQAHRPGMRFSAPRFSPVALMGGGLLDLRTIGNLRVPAASIGGAGTVDGISLTGIVALWLV